MSLTITEIVTRQHFS